MIKAVLMYGKDHARFDMSRRAIMYSDLKPPFKGWMCAALSCPIAIYGVVKIAMTSEAAIFQMRERGRVIWAR